MLGAYAARNALSDAIGEANLREEWQKRRRERMKRNRDADAGPPRQPMRNAKALIS